MGRGSEIQVQVGENTSAVRNYVIKKKNAIAYMKQNHQSKH